MEHKGPVLRPRCTGPGRAQTQIPFNSVCHLGWKWTRGQYMHKYTISSMWQASTSDRTNKPNKETNKITAWSRVLLEKVTGLQNFFAFYGT